MVVIAQNKADMARSTGQRGAPIGLSLCVTEHVNQGRLHLSSRFPFAPRAGAGLGGKIQLGCFAALWQDRDMSSAPRKTDRPPRLAETQRRMAEVLQDNGRAANAAQLVAISKTKPAAQITPLLDAGHRLFGENRVQEAKDKWPPLKAQYKDTELHLVGPLQTNKVKDAVALFDVIETLDREKLARKLAELKDESGFPRLMIQVNTGDEPQKSGILPSELAAFHEFCRDGLGLRISGLMCLPPQNEPAGPHFVLLGRLAEQLGVAELSMGMSGDFETALALGATHIRLGTAIFGARN
jgi:pyridoxal phosphate enzyme (YggS family)